VNGTPSPACPAAVRHAGAGPRAVPAAAGVVHRGGVVMVVAAARVRGMVAAAGRMVESGRRLAAAVEM